MRKKRVKHVNALMWENMPCKTSLKYKHSIQFRKENADGTTINSLVLCKIALLTEILILHSA